MSDIFKISSPRGLLLCIIVIFSIILLRASSTVSSQQTNSSDGESPTSFRTTIVPYPMKEASIIVLESSDDVQYPYGCVKYNNDRYALCMSYPYMLAVMGFEPIAIVALSKNHSNRKVQTQSFGPCDILYNTTTNDAS